MSPRPGTLAVHLLGDLEVEGVDVTEFGSRKARGLLRALALGRGRPVSVDVLVDTLWGARPPARPADQVSVLVSRLRSSLGRDRIEHSDGGYRLRYDWLDVDALHALVAEAESRLEAGAFTAASTAARAATALIRGSPPDDVFAGDWASGEVAALQRLVLRARRLAAEALLGVGDHGAAAELARRVLHDDPYAEDAVRVLMRAEAAGGRLGVALTAYAELRELLDRELGSSPSPATESLHTAILRGQVPSADATPRGRVEVSLVGRRHELARLDDLVAEAGPAVPVVVVVGEAGIGKTTLVNAWAARRRHSGDQVLTVQCGAVGRSVPFGALSTGLARHLRGLGHDRLAAVLGPDHEFAAPLLGLAATTAHRTLLADNVAGPALLHASLTGAMSRLAGEGRLLLVVDDVHNADRAFVEWLGSVSGRVLPLVVVATARTGQVGDVPARLTVELGPLSAEEVRDLVGDGRAGELFERSGGHPLFLTELARAEDGELPATLIEALSAQCDDLGEPAATAVRSAAVVDAVVDLDLLATVLSRPAIEVLADLERAAARKLLVEADGTFCFRHDLVRTALAAGASRARTTLLHRETGRALERRGGDPSAIAHHARLGDDPVLAASALRSAATRAADRFDHATAEALLDGALELDATAELWAERARVRLRRADYDGALGDVAACREAGGDAADIGAWSAYYQRRFELARSYAEEGLTASSSPQVRARSLVIGGRIAHATGALATADDMLTRAVGEVDPAEHVIARAWLGTLRSHQSRTDEALQLLAPATRPLVGAQHTPTVLHALLFTGHALAIAGRPAAALDVFSRYEHEAVRRDVDRFVARGSNMSGWVLHSLGAVDEAESLHQEAYETGGRQRFAEMQVASLEDRAEIALMRGDLVASTSLLDAAQRLLEAGASRMVFGWRLAMKLAWLRGRTALSAGDAAGALSVARSLGADAGEHGIPRYSSVATLLAVHARHHLGETVSPAEVESALDAVTRAVPLESWWLTGETGEVFGEPALLARAAARMNALADAAGERGPALRAHAAHRLEEWEQSAFTRP